MVGEVVEKNDFLLKEGIKKELQLIDYIFSEEDKQIAKEMLREINELEYDFQYLAELEYYEVKGIGEIVKKYINQFSSEATRAYLIHQLVFNKVENCSEYILDLYMHFKSSKEYISGENQPAPAHIYVRYDNALKRLKSKKIKNQLIELAYNPRDVYYLPLTVSMLASWKILEIKELLLSYLDGANITSETIGIPKEGKYYPSLETIKREVKFTALDGLKYYPEKNVYEVVEQYILDSDSDVSELAKKVLRVMGKKK